MSFLFNLGCLKLHLSFYKRNTIPKKERIDINE